MPKIELVKQITKGTGNVYYFTRVDDYMISGTWTSDFNEAEQLYAKTIQDYKDYPETVYETLKSNES